MNIKHKIKSTLVCSAILASVAIANGQDYSFEKIPLNDTNIAQLTNVVKQVEDAESDITTTVLGTNVVINGEDSVTVKSEVLNVSNRTVIGGRIDAKNDIVLSGNFIQTTSDDGIYNYSSSNGFIHAEKYGSIRSSIGSMGFYVIGVILPNKLKIKGDISSITSEA